MLLLDYSVHTSRRQEGREREGSGGRGDNNFLLSVSYPPRLGIKGDGSTNKCQSIVQTDTVWLVLFSQNDWTM